MIPIDPLREFGTKETVFPQDLPVAGWRPGLCGGHLRAAPAAAGRGRARHGRRHGVRRARRPHALEPRAALPAAADAHSAGRHARSVCTL